MVGKKYKVVLAINSIRRLQGIYKYYKEKGEPDLGRKVKGELLKESKRLKELPNSKMKLPSKKQVVPPIRYTKKWSYKIVFQVFENDDSVLILDFIHDRENPEKWESL